MDYQRYTPDDDLADAVEHFWTVRADGFDPPRREVLVPNGRPTVQVRLGASGTRIDPRTATRALHADVLLPTAARPYVLEQAGPSDYLGAQLTPWGAWSLWGGGAVTGNPLPLTGLHPSHRLPYDVPSLQAWLRASRHPGARAPGALRDAVAAADADPAGSTVARLAAAVGASPATLRRWFTERVGIAPRTYLSVARYRAFTDALLSPGTPSTAMLAALSGYVDQSHASRDFVRFTGLTPARFREDLHGIAVLMASP